MRRVTRQVTTELPWLTHLGKSPLKKVTPVLHPELTHLRLTQPVNHQMSSNSLTPTQILISYEEYYVAMVTQHHNTYVQYSNIKGKEEVNLARRNSVHIRISTEFSTGASVLSTLADLF